jgi:cell wall-associated NlpC family hydrolase
MPLGRHVPRHSGSIPYRFRAFCTGSAGLARRAVVLAGAVALCAAIVPGGSAVAAPAAGTANPSLKTVLAEAKALSEQIDHLSQQFDALKIQLSQAKAAASVARQDAARDQLILSKDQSSIGAIAVENYMSGGINPTLQLLTTASPQSLLDRASIMTQLQQENGRKVSLVADAVAAAQRAQEAAAQEQQQAKSLTAAMAAKEAAIQKKENFFNGEAYKKAQAIFQQTGKYPITASEIPGDSYEVQALKLALGRAAAHCPYVWAAAGPCQFDCSGLVMWAYAQVGITLAHFTGDQWNEIVHVPRSELKPGYLMFFYNLDHVGLYIGNGLMVDAPTFGQDVQVQAVPWASYDGGGYPP